MRKYLCAFAFAILAGRLFGSSAFAADDTLVRFKGGIGVHPVSNISGTATNPPTNSIFPEVTRNIVRGVNPAGQIWVIDNLKANVKVDGRIRVDGRGLLLAGGNNIGLNANASVFATLICEAAAPFTERSTTVTGVPLAANGDFEIDDVLTPFPLGDCASPVLLIRNASGGTWFAAGILDLGGKKDD
jgi:hypothetical protein